MRSFHGCVRGVLGAFCVVCGVVAIAEEPASSEDSAKGTEVYDVLDYIPLYENYVFVARSGTDRKRYKSDAVEGFGKVVRSETSDRTYYSMFTGVKQECTEEYIVFDEDYVRRYRAADWDEYPSTDIPVYRWLPRYFVPGQSISIDSSFNDRLGYTVLSTRMEHGALSDLVSADLSQYLGTYPEGDKDDCIALFTTGVNGQVIMSFLACRGLGIITETTYSVRSRVSESDPGLEPLCWYDGEPGEEIPNPNVLVRWDDIVQDCEVETRTTMPIFLSTSEPINEFALDFSVTPSNTFVNWKAPTLPEGWTSQHGSATNESGQKYYYLLAQNHFGAPLLGNDIHLWDFEPNCQNHCPGTITINKGKFYLGASGASSTPATVTCFAEIPEGEGGGEGEGGPEAELGGAPIAYFDGNFSTSCSSKTGLVRLMVDDVWNLRDFKFKLPLGMSAQPFILNNPKLGSATLDWESISLSIDPIAEDGFDYVIEGHAGSTGTSVSGDVQELASFSYRCIVCPYSATVPIVPDDPAVANFTGTPIAVDCQKYKTDVTLEVMQGNPDARHADLRILLDTLGHPVSIVRLKVSSGLIDSIPTLVISNVVAGSAVENWSQEVLASRPTFENVVFTPVAEEQLLGSNLELLRFSVDCNIDSASELLLFESRLDAEFEIVSGYHNFRCDPLPPEGEGEGAEPPARFWIEVEPGACGVRRAVATLKADLEEPVRGFSVYASYDDTKLMYQDAAVAGLPEDWTFTSQAQNLPEDFGPAVVAEAAGSDASLLSGTDLELFRWEFDCGTCPVQTFLNPYRVTLDVPGQAKAVFNFPADSAFVTCQQPEPECVWREGEMSGIHQSDCNADGAIQMSELLRFIQLYNVGTYHCDTITSDGFGVGDGDQTGCDPHSGDYAEPQWSLSLSEILRLVQIFQLGGYETCTEGETEDGYCPMASEG